METDHYPHSDTLWQSGTHPHIYPQVNTINATLRVFVFSHLLQIGIGDARFKITVPVIMYNRNFNLELDLNIWWISGNNFACARD